MFKKFILIGCLFLAASFSAVAQDNGRVNQLEQEIQSIKLRLSKLEAAQGISTDAPKAPVSGDGWKSLASWRQLTAGMTPNDVKRILGEPYRVNGGEVATWFYPNRSDVTFMSNKLYSWSEPR